MRLAGVQGVAVSHLTRSRVVAADGQGIAQCGRDRLREAIDHPCTDHIDAANRQRLQTISRGHGKSAALGQRRRVGAAAVRQVFLEQHQLAAVDAQPVELHRIIEVADVQHQVGAGIIAIGISQGVGKGLDAIPTAMQVDEVRIGSVERIGVGTIGRQHQRAVGANEGAGSDRPARYPVCALHIVGQHVAGKGQLVFRGGDGIGIGHRLRHIVNHGDIQRTTGYVAIGVTDQYRDAFAKPIGASAAWVVFGSAQGVAVADHAAASIVAGDGQHITQAGGDRLANASHRSSSNNVDATDIEVEHPIRCLHRETATPGQGRRITGRTLGQIGLVQRQLATLDIKPLEVDRVVDRRQRRCIVIVVDQADVQLRQLGKTVEACSGKANLRIYPPGHLIENDEGMPAAQCTRRTASARPRRSRVGFLGRVGAGGDGLLEFLDISQLCLAGSRRLRRLDMRRLVRQQLRGQGQAATAAEGKFGTVLQVDGDSARKACVQLLAGIHLIAFDQRPAAAIAAHSEDFAHYLADDTD
ncbi:hypothetical protein D3C77_91990 [compost metagenome]